MPGQAVIVVSFPEPQSDVELAKYIRNVKAPFVTRTDVKVHMAVNDVADKVIEIFSPLHEQEKNGSDDG